MTEQEEIDKEVAQTAAALALLDEALDNFTKDVREVIHRKINDSMNVDDILNGTTILGNHERPALVAQRVMLAWARRILLETLSDDFGPERVEREFIQIFWQISGQHLGTEDFQTKLAPISIQQEEDARKLASNANAAAQGKHLPYPKFKPTTVQPVVDVDE